MVIITHRLTIDSGIKRTTTISCETPEKITFELTSDVAIANDPPFWLASICHVYVGHFYFHCYLWYTYVFCFIFSALIIIMSKVNIQSPELFYKFIKTLRIYLQYDLDSHFDKKMVAAILKFLYGVTCKIPCDIQYRWRSTQISTSF